ncbi:hypothetical protein F2Q69_00056425 [Brassica cretica]|uniref:Uncharacterized protein n=1 Tax=Brassica cretica TaxID=69181 RepID=A0A8S9MZY6_BRACR|nr:hypothetical protein F2Q69_00056425 [Brassica cretica]
MDLRRLGTFYPPLFGLFYLVSVVARNSLIFEAKSSNPVDVATRALKLAREWITQPVAEPPCYEEGQLTHIPTGSDKEPRNIEESETTCKTDCGVEQTIEAGWSHLDLLRKRIQSSSPRIELPRLRRLYSNGGSFSNATRHHNPTFRMSSDNLKLIKAINHDLQVKEIHGIVCDIHGISSAWNRVFWVDMA